MQTSRKSHGYTLIELLIVIALIGITIGVTADIILTLVRSYSKTQATNELERSANFMVTKFEKEFKNAVSVTYAPSAPYNWITLETKYLNDPVTKTITYRYDLCPVDGVNVGCIKRCYGDNSCAVGDWQNVTDPSNVVVSGVTGNNFFSPVGVTNGADAVTLKLRFTKNATTTPFTGELSINSTVVAKGTYR